MSTPSFDAPTEVSGSVANDPRKPWTHRIDTCRPPLKGLQIGLLDYIVDLISEQTPHQGAHEGLFIEEVLEILRKWWT